MARIIVYYFLFLFFLLTIFCSGVVDSQDGFQYLAVARNIYYKGKPTAPPYEFDTRENIYMSVMTGKNGESYGYTGLGFSVALVPAVLITDVVYKIYNIPPLLHFPLENDWLILLTASFVNAFWGALLGAILFTYFILLGLNKKEAIIMGLVSIFATNLFVYTKHIMPHMMFVILLMSVFLFIKLYSLKKRKFWLLFGGISYGVLSITYNPTFILSFIPLVLYYLLLTKPKFNKSNTRLVLRDALLVMVGMIPFLLIYLWFENLRAFADAGINYADLSYYNEHVKRFSLVPITVFIEGLYGQLFSPGRSIFIYSPLLIILVLFWHKIKPWMKPELIAFLLLSTTYILFYAAQYSIGAPDQGIAGLWHGENSWGPRYLSVLIPFGMLIVGHIFIQLNKLQKLFIFLPLLIIGLYIEILGVLLPYQTKYFNLQEKFILNSTEYKVSLYSNLLPRYTPIINMSKNLVKLADNFPKTLDHGMYNVRFYDGIDFPFNVGPERWRTIEGKGYISFDNNIKSPVKQLTFGLINHPISEASESAKIQFYLNNTKLLEEPYKLDITQREQVNVQVKENLAIEKNNNLIIEVNYDDPKVITQGKQILGLQAFDINGQRQNLESIDVPYVSSLGPKIAGVNYQNWGGTNQDRWKLWSVHTQTFERIPDFWWVRNLYYWDIPKKWILIPLAINLTLLIFFGYKLFKLRKSIS